ncbi:MAG TPA: YceI family protein [Gemmataceae bacterium]|nr:YceI family protein [Gemmataceae bacterium]
MRTTIRLLGLVVLVAAASLTARAADTYMVDPVHSSISFKISHIGISYIHGRFDDFSGQFTIDKDDPSKSSFALSIKVESVDTNNPKRDEHLRNADYFNAKQFPAMTFQSTSVKPVPGGYDVTGDLTLHGVTKPVGFTLKGGDKTVEFPKGMQRIGFTTNLVIKRSDFDMKTDLGALGDEIPIDIGVEAAK